MGERDWTGIVHHSASILKNLDSLESERNQAVKNLRYVAKHLQQSRVYKKAKMEAQV